MAYSFQIFSVGAVLTAAQMNAVEVNIRDHTHGTSGNSEGKWPGNIMIGSTTVSPDTTLHVYKGDSGGSSNAGAGITFEDDVDTYLQMLVPGSGAGNYLHGIFFGDAGNSTQGMIRFDHQNNKLEFRTDGTNSYIQINSSGQLVSSLATGTAPLSVASTTKVANLNADLLDDLSAVDLLGWKRISTIELGADSQSINFTGLNGDTDITYMLIYRILGGASGHSLRIRLNNDSTANYSDNYFYGVTSITGIVNNANSGGYLTSGTSLKTHGKIIINAKSGYIRTLLTESGGVDASNNIAESGFSRVVWKNTVDNITSIDIVASSAAMILTGSRAELWARR